MVRCDECGLEPPVMAPWNAKREHDQHHEWWESGIPLPSGASRPVDGYLTVPAIGPKADRRLAHQMARLSQRELDHEVLSFRHPKWMDWKGWTEHETTAYLAVVDDRVVGYALTRLRNIWGMVDLKRNPYDWMSGPIRHEATRPCIDMVFVSVRYRGQGVAASLLRFVAESNGVPVDHIVHTYPLSEPGSRLAKAFSVNGRYLVAVGT